MFRETLLAIVAAVTVGGPIAQHSVPHTPRPVRMLKQPEAADIDFIRFEFQEPRLYELSAHYGRIDGEPRPGEEYGVEASIGGEEAIASVSFDAIDEAGRTMQRLPMVFTRENHYSEFIGLMNVPSRPFRIVMSGESVDGQTFTRVYPRLFRPAKAAKPASSLPPGMTQEEAAAFQQMLDHVAPATISKRQALTAGNPSGLIVMPHVRIAALSYAPLLAAAGRPRGVRVTYNATFSEGGEYSPQLDVYPKEKGDTLLDVNSMHVIDSRITPLPRELKGAGHELDYVLAQREHRHLANFLYEPDTVYRFVVDLVPNFVGFDKDNATTCFAGKRFQLKWNGQDRLALRLRAEEPAEYRLSIRAAGLEGLLENFYSEKTFYETFMAEGLRDCAP